METHTLDEGLLRTVAPNGFTVLSERLPGIRSAALGIWVRSASVHEPRELMGSSHLLEHLVFKGTGRRSAKQLAEELEVRGGSLDAYTSRDHTSFQAHVLDADVPLAVEILTDLVRDPLLRPEDLELERNVVLDEIDGVHDTPDDLVFELHTRTLWPDHPYGYSILGTRETVRTLTAPDLTTLHRGGYYPGNCIFAAAGQVDHGQLLTVLEREGWFEGEPQPPRPPVPAAPAIRGAALHEERDTQQSHIVLGTDTFDARDQRRYGLAILANILGGGMSSRLFQRVREELGLAYAVYSFHSLYQSTGMLGVYVGTQPRTAGAAEAVIRAELDRLAREGLSEPELASGRQQLKGQVMLALESPGSRMLRLAATVLHYDPYRRLDEILAEIDGVSSETVAALAAEFFNPDRWSVVRLGPDGRAVRR
ncbi:MAG TPA: pitrilysin family protein [Gemmatimonadales bacterium]|nr:pitrilysin family protein [Gemmatimonadales bacterium]